MAKLYYIDSIKEKSRKKQSRRTIVIRVSLALNALLLIILGATWLM